ncbi:50S ribosomal protein L1 [Candidatus Tisiphia endosymbiont of Ceraclea dissimilis]|uniref:50S ribosomal protein L1 n=1 Tax=Candidatus Tisiphia endosymbiont of Ceraclea dissimilis TaxID=3077928 RepID=UPI0025C7AE09|nr:50S ribosomal protein L1 [Candidatus Tisiphia sp.]
MIVDKKDVVNNRKLTGGKKIRAARKNIELASNRTLAEGIEALQSASYTKFDSTLEVVMKLGVDPKHSDQMVRGVVALPAGTGKVSRVAVICKDEQIEEAKAAGADMAGSTEIIDDIKAGKINFDVCIATPNMMSAIGSVARILGPKGLMPNPKLGTVTTDIVTAIKNAKSGQVEYRVEKAGIIHAGVGKLSFTKQDLVNNASTLISAVVKAKPSGAKGNYLKAIYLSSTMGPSVKIDLATIS